jgi:hypothetical protein
MLAQVYQKKENEIIENMNLLGEGISALKSIICLHLNFR